MDIVWHDITDSEPLPIAIAFRGSYSSVEIKGIQETLHQELDRLNQEEERDRYLAKIYLVNVDGNKLFFEADWVPHAWLERLDKILAPWSYVIETIEIGHDFVPFERSDDFIHVDHKTVEFEDGRRCSVDPFWIAKSPVSIGQFLEFTEKTGYRTIAQRRDDEYWFFNPPSLLQVPAEKRLNVAASFLSYVDATAYCDWAGVRLPTEEEHLAAWLIDDHIYEPSEAEERREQLRKQPNALWGFDDELTSTIENEKVVVRSGPAFLRTTDGVRSPHYRQLVSRQYYEGLSFRVCRIDS